ncbi:hypothetical protein [Variovorax sp. MHTC-1]|nr:hypothetical protein [Variovorax sp. MHTC-1]
MSSNSVVLPDPLGPSTPTTAGSSISKSARREMLNRAAICRSDDIIVS